MTNDECLMSIAVRMTKLFTRYALQNDLRRFII